MNGNKGWKREREGARGGEKVMGLLDLTSSGGGGLAAHAGGVDGFGRDEVQVFIIRDLIQPVSIFQQLDVQILVYLLQEATNSMSGRAA